MSRKAKPDGNSFVCQLQHATCNSAAAAVATSTAAATAASSVLTLTKLQQHFPSVYRSLVFVSFLRYFLFPTSLSPCLSFDALKVRFSAQCGRVLYKTVCPTHTKPHHTVLANSHIACGRIHSAVRHSSSDPSNGLRSNLDGCETRTRTSTRSRAGTGPRLHREKGHKSGD